MRVIYCLISLLVALSSSLSAQNDTLVGVLRDIRQKAIKRQPITLGSQSPITRKTNRQGVFKFPNANLHDTLYIHLKKTKKMVSIPLKGYNYVTITIDNNNFKAQQSFEPDEDLREILERGRNKLISSSVMNKDEIQKSGCRDLYCVLRRMSGISFFDDSIRIRASASLNSPSEPLVVVDGIPMEIGILNTLPIQEVEEIKVLKDAGEYGVRGANGAIIIKTTK